MYSRMELYYQFQVSSNFELPAPEDPLPLPTAFTNNQRSPENMNETM